MSSGGVLVAPSPISSKDGEHAAVPCQPFGSFCCHLQPPQYKLMDITETPHAVTQREELAHTATNLQQILKYTLVY